MPNLIWSPEIFCIGETKFNEDEFTDWVGFNDLSSKAADTPITRLYDGVEDDFACERMMEFAGRHCYRAWEKGRDAASYIRNIIDMEHGSVLEHGTWNLAIQGVSRSLSHELVRHRVGVAISQESQRYVDAKDMQFVIPPLMVHTAGGSDTYIDPATGQRGKHPLIQRFDQECARDVAAYVQLQDALDTMLAAKESNTKRDTMRTKRCNETARSMLPNACETRLVWTANGRLLRHFFFLRGGFGADLEIRRLAVAILEKLQSRTHTVFSDLTVDYSQDFSYGVGVIKKK